MELDNGHVVVPDQRQSFLSETISFAAKDSVEVKQNVGILVVGVAVQDMEKDDRSRFQNPVLEKLDSQLNGLVSKVCTEEAFTGEVGQWTALMRIGDGWVTLIGIGIDPALSFSDAYFGLGAAAASVAMACKENSMAVVLASYDGLTSKSKRDTAFAIADGTLWRRFGDTLLCQSKASTLKSVDLVGFGSEPKLVRGLEYREYSCACFVIVAGTLISKLWYITYRLQCILQSKLKAAAGFGSETELVNRLECRKYPIADYFTIIAEVLCISGASRMKQELVLNSYDAGAEGRVIELVTGRSREDPFGKHKYNFTANINTITRNPSYSYPFPDAEHWWLDCGASDHISNNKRLFKTFRPVRETAGYLADNTIVRAEGIGRVDVPLLPSGHTVELDNVILFPTILRNLVSIQQLVPLGYKVGFNKPGQFRLKKGGETVGGGCIDGGLYKIHTGQVVTHNIKDEMMTDVNHADVSIGPGELFKFRTCQVLTHSIKDEMMTDVNHVDASIGPS